MLIVPAPTAAPAGVMLDDATDWPRANFSTCTPNDVALVAPVTWMDAAALLDEVAVIEPQVLF